MEKNYYTYAYLREDESPYYIGKGKNNRVYKKGRGEVNPPKDKSRIIFLKQNLTEEEAFKHEVYMIGILGRKDLGTGILRNKTDGGEGSSGLIHSEKTKRILSEANKGKNNHFYGKSHSEETKRILSEVKKGKNHPFYGKSHSEETRKRISDSKKGKNNHFYGKSHSEETKKILSEKNKGENHPNYGKSPSEETRKRMSESKKKSGVKPPSPKGKKWWHDGRGNSIRCKECPGEGWVSGRGQKK